MRRREFVQEAIARATGVSEKAENSIDPTYASQLPATVRAAYDHLIAVVDAGSSRVGPVPALLLTQARLAAAVDLSLEELLRRCLAINSLLTIYLLQEAENVPLPRQGRDDLARTQAAVFDQVIDTVVQEYNRAVIGRCSLGERKLALVKGLLAGEFLDPSELSYELGQHHLGICVQGEGPARALPQLASRLDASLLVVRPGESLRWAWLGTHHPAPAGVVGAAIREVIPSNALVAVGTGEPGFGGWRATHLQAKAAFSICLRRSCVVRYEDVALEASAIQDPVLSSFLRHRYLEPIKQGPRDGEALLETLRAYFSTDRNGASTSAAVGVSRQTVTNRLRAIEERLGRPLQSCTADVELGLRLDDLERTSR
jgi:hypothetical protein